MFLIVGIVVVFIDQITKAIVRRYIPVGYEITIIPHVFSITHTKNSGALFGLFKDYAKLLAFLSIFVILIIIYIERIFNLPFKGLAFGLILGGIIGNFIDRLTFSYVTDFLYIHKWPVFNIADAAIDIGITLFVLMYLKYGK